MQFYLNCFSCRLHLYFLVIAAMELGSKLSVIYFHDLVLIDM